MLNITENKILDLDITKLKSFNSLKKLQTRKLPAFVLLVLFIILFLCLFLPWTQNISAKGSVTTKFPEQRPQAVQSVISGKLNKWYVREGDFVNKGDTLAHVTDIKSEYFDPELVNRTTDQVNAKSNSIVSYSQKVDALEDQFKAIRGSQKIKLEQTRNKIKQTKNKIQIDSIDYIAEEQQLAIAENQYERVKELHNKGLKSLSELQEKEIKAQQKRAKLIAQENKLEISRNSLTNLILELESIQTEYADKMAKSASDRQSAISAQQEAIASTSKLQNQLSNYSERQQFYYITAPQAGYVTKTVKKGIGEIIKQGADLMTIAPSTYDLAVEAYVLPQDLPLLDIGREVKMRFDGWPAIIISGWPESATGIFTGEIIAVDRFINEKGFYRILVQPKEDTKKWPNELRVGSGVQAFILLRNVPIWYEIWRQLNGFPPDYYGDKESDQKIKRKAPIKSIK